MTEEETKLERLVDGMAPAKPSKAGCGGCALCEVDGVACAFRFPVNSLSSVRGHTLMKAGD